MTGKELDLKGKSRRIFLRGTLMALPALAVACTTDIKIPKEATKEEIKTTFDGQFRGNYFADTSNSSISEELAKVRQAESRFGLKIICPITRNNTGTDIPNTCWNPNELDKVLLQGLECTPPVCFDPNRNSNPVEKVYLIRPDGPNDYNGGGYAIQRVIKKLNPEMEARDNDPEDKRGLMGFSSRLVWQAAEVVHEFIHNLQENHPELLDSFVRFHGWSKIEVNGKTEWTSNKKFPGSVKGLVQAQKSPIEAMAWDAGYVAARSPAATTEKLYEWFNLPENRVVFGDWQVLNTYH